MATHDRGEPSGVGRHVFYIGGFFTGGPAFYRRYLVREAARYARVHQVAVEVADRHERDGLYPGYLLSWQGAKGAFKTIYELLSWEDIVLAEFAKPWSRRLPDALATFVDYLTNGAFLGMLRAMRRFAVIWLFPFLFYGIGSLGAALAGLGAALAAARLGAGETAAFLSGLIASGSLLLLVGAFGRTSFAYLLLNDFIFSRAIALDRAPEIWTRLDAFADHLADEMVRWPEREYVLVGHSFGASLAPLLVARLFERHAVRLEGGSLTLVTLGGSLALIGLHPAASRFRAGIQGAASRPDLDWFDVSSSHDPINIKRFDAVEWFDLADSISTPRSAMLLDTQFKAASEPGFFARLRFMRLHMHFIMASEKPGAYDYIGAITSPAPIRQTLADLAKAAETTPAT